MPSAKQCEYGFYDALNRLTQIVYPDETVTYTWDSCTNGVGRLCSIADGAGTTSYAFDVKGRVTAKTQVVAGVTQAMGYAYNAAGQLTTVTTPSGRSVVYTYANNRPVSVTVDGTTVLDTVFYEPFGPNGGWRWGNSTTPAPNLHTRLHDKDFRMTRVTSDLPVTGTQPYFDRQFGWDHASRITSLTDLANSALSATYGFDALDRLTSTSQGSSSWGYAYSGVGDRTTSTVGASTTTYTYATGTHRLQSLSGAQTKSYSFDAAGNMTSDGTRTWTYGGNNRATAAGSTSFTINALGQRVKKAGSATTRFVYDEAGRLWGEYTSAGALVQETVWLDDLPIATLRPNGSSFDLYYVHADQLGTPRAVTRPSHNAIVWRWDNTEAFGNSTPNEDPSGLGTFAFNLRFPGQYYDVETGKHYNYYRDYDPSVARYLQSDPIGIGGGLNTYGYVEANPLHSFDPFGLQLIIGGAGGTGALIGGAGLRPGGTGNSSGGWNGGDNWKGSWPDSANEPQYCPPPPPFDPCKKRQDDLNFKKTKNYFHWVRNHYNSEVYRSNARNINREIDQHNGNCPNNKVDPQDLSPLRPSKL